jgi:hypothetical protein
MADAHKNFAYSTIATAPSPAASGTSLVVASGQGALFPAVPFNATIWPTGAQPTSTNAEIVRVTNISSDTFTITRTQESTSARTIVVGDQIAASITAKTLTDIEDNFVNSWSPYIPPAAGNGVQSLARSSVYLTTGSLFVFPVTVQFPVKFNQIIMPVQLSVVTSALASTANNNYFSKFGIYSMVTNTPNTLLSLISSNSFSIGETISSVNLTWNYPTTTATAGYGYGSFPAGNLTAAAQMASFVSGTRAIGMQFGGEMTLSGGQYWIGVMSQRSMTTGGAAASAIGLSNVGIVGQIMNPINQPGTVSGVLPIGIVAAEWAQKNTNISGWFGRHIAGIVTASSVPNFGGTRIPDNISLIHLGGVGASSTGTVLPSVTFCST